MASLQTDSSSLLGLPVEILHHIFSYIDIKTLVLSVSNVCKCLRAISRTYHRYELDFRSISKSDFFQICRSIEPRNVISLSLSDDYRTPGQINLFLSLFSIRDFNRLVSLSLLSINDEDLRLILSVDLPRTLKSLTIDWRESHRPSLPTLMLLLSIVDRLTLQTLQLKSGSYAMEDMIWPIQNTIEQLTLMYITHRQYCTLLRQVKNLRKVTLNHCSMHELDETITKCCSPIHFFQLTSLTLYESRLSMNSLESLLALTPSLTSLKLICSPDTFDTIADAIRWEKLIRQNLIKLRQFEFFFTNTYNVYYRPRDISYLISRFQTPFWLEEKRWFVRCDYINYLNQIMLYTVPICTPEFTYESEANKISYTSLTSLFHESLLTAHVRTLNLTLTKLKLGAATSKKTRSPTVDYLFANISKLTIDVDDEWSVDYIHYLSNIVNLSKLEKIVFNPDIHHQSITNTVSSINLLMKLAVQLSSLTIHPYFSHYQSEDEGDDITFMQYICSMIPNNIRYLEVSVRNTENMKLIFNHHCHHLRSLTFLAALNQAIPWSEFIFFLNEKNEHFTYWESFYSLRIWLTNE